MIGPDTHSINLDKFEKENKIQIPDDKGGASLGTYIMPCRAFGLLDTKNDPNGSIVVVTPRGQSIANARKQKLTNSKLTQLILHGGTMHRADIEEEGVFFSMNHIDSIPDEKKQLIEAMVEPYIDRDDVNLLYDNFQQTLVWALERFKKEDALSGANLIRDNYQNIAYDESDVNGVELIWFDYDLHRRVHYALESFLSAFTTALTELNGASVSKVVSYWSNQSESPQFISDRINITSLEYEDVVELLLRNIPKELYLGETINRRSAMDLDSPARAIYSLTMLIACKKQSKYLRDNHILKDYEQTMEKAFAILDECQPLTIKEVMKRLLEEVVIEPHIGNTLRKMEQGQKCSLRFYPEGTKMKPTGTYTGAGYSGERLGNVLGMLADVGILQRVDSGGLSITGEGKEYLEAWSLA